MRRRGSLITRLLMFSVAAVVLPALLISVVIHSISSRALLKSIQREQREVARRLAEQINSEVQNAHHLVQLVARNSSFSAGSRVDQYEALRNLLQASNAFQETMLVHRSGLELLKVSQGASPRLVSRPEDVTRSFIGAPFFSANRAPTILLGEPITTFANPIRGGAILAKMSFTQLGELVSQATVGPRGIAYIVDSKGFLLAHPDEKLVFAHTSRASRAVVSDWTANPIRPTGLTEDKDDRGADLLSIAYPISLLKSAVIIQQPKEDVYAPLKRMRLQFILWTLVSVLVFLLVAIGVSWKILKPMRKLQHAVEEVGRGKRNIHLDIRTQDELEDLATTFEKMTESLAELEEVRRDLISMIVHDLKMPLSTVLPSLENLLTGDVGHLSKDQRHFVQMARRSSQEMLMLIENLLDVAKIEEGKLTLHQDVFLPQDWAHSVVNNFQPTAEAAKKKLTLQSASDMAPVEADMALLSRVLGNLISNALHHTLPVIGEVAVALFRDGTQLAVEVRDNGEGIPEEEQAHIFEKFVQGGVQKAHMRTGAGLGLTFCKMVVEAHGGHITVYSQPREGSLFTFRLAFKEVVQKEYVYEK